MHLQRVEIKNYRSIGDATVYFSPRCRVLVGINESGKTNILSALSLLDKENEPKPSDLREFRPDEPYDQEAHVEFYFSIKPHELSTVYNDLIQNSVFEKPNTPVIRLNEHDLTLKTIYTIEKHAGIYCRPSIEEKAADWIYAS